MANETKRVTINSIAGGLSVSNNESAQNEFVVGLGIDPSLPLNDTASVFSDNIASGSIRPVSYRDISGSTLNQAPVWLVKDARNTTIFVYGASGSAYTLGDEYAFTALSDGGALSASSGNGCEYYDNYIYFSKNTTVARYGPLNGTPAFDGDYWGTTLGKTALTDTTYPNSSSLPLELPNHVLQRHSDGVLYLGDVVGNQGVIHSIKTRKTTVEGDTDDGSTYNLLDFGYGLWPTALESYGTNLVIALYDGGLRAKLAFWDTVSPNANIISNDEFPDPIITGLKNINGTLYILSGQVNTRGLRLSRYVGGSSFEEVMYSQTGYPPLPGAIDGSAQRVLSGSTEDISNSPIVYSYGAQQAAFGDGLFTPVKINFTDPSSVTSLLLDPFQTFSTNLPIVGWSDGTISTTNNGLSVYSGPGATIDYAARFQSRVFSVGAPFKIKRIALNFYPGIGNTDSVQVAVRTDSGLEFFNVGSITNSNYSGKTRVILRPENVTGKYNFSIYIDIGSSVQIQSIVLPIDIDYEIYDD